LFTAIDGKQLIPRRREPGFVPLSDNAVLCAVMSALKKEDKMTVYAVWPDFTGESL